MFDQPFIGYLFSRQKALLLSGCGPVCLRLSLMIPEHPWDKKCLQGQKRRRCTCLHPEIKSASRPAYKPRMNCKCTGCQPPVYIGIIPRMFLRRFTLDLVCSCLHKDVKVFCLGWPGRGTKHAVTAHLHGLPSRETKRASRNSSVRAYSKIKFPDMSCMRRAYKDKKASFHLSAANNKEHFSSCG